MTRQSNPFVISFTWLFVFSVAMGFLESAVVVYIRELYYPEGFTFPLRVMDEHLILTELFRELATLIMLAGIAWQAGRTRYGRFGFFLVAFGTWDVFYYIFLKLLIGWPESLMTWDILFMLPTTWVGPVLAPCLNALTMVFLGALLAYYNRASELPPSLMESRNRTTNSHALSLPEWTLLVTGSIIILYTYMEDYVKYVSGETGLLRAFFPGDTHEMMQIAVQYVPSRFSWIVFIVGQALLITATGIYWGRMGRMPKSEVNY